MTYGSGLTWFRTHLVQDSPVCCRPSVHQVVGLYRLCGSAAVKKELRDWFERNSSAVCLSEDLYPDINVITGECHLRTSYTWPQSVYLQDLTMATRCSVLSQVY